MRAAVAVCTMLALAGNAAAQPGLTPASPPSSDGQPASAPDAPGATMSFELAQPPREAHDRPLPGERDEQSALLLSLGGAAASWGMMAAADATHHYTLTGIAAASSLITPSFGHWYAGSSDVLWLGLRGAAVATMYYGVLSVAVCDDGCSNAAPGAVALAVGIAGYVASTIADIATAPSAARRHNRAVRSWTVAPMAHRDSGGLAIAGQF